MSARRAPLRIYRVPVVAFLAIFFATSIPFLFTRHLAEQQDRRVLAQKADTIRINVATLVAEQRAAIRALGTSLQTASTDPNDFADIADEARLSNSFTAMALVDITSPAPSILASSGKLQDPLIASTPAFQTAAKAIKSGQPFTNTGPLRAGDKTYIGYFSGPPIAPAGRALYAELIFDPGDPQVVAAVLGADEDIDSALYADEIVPTKLLLTTTDKLPLRGTMVIQPVTVGDHEWRLVVRERRPAADPLTRAVPWIILGSGLIIAVLATFSINSLMRRRDDALRLAKERNDENLLILEAAREAFISMDDRGMITRWSAQAELLFGYSSGEVLGRPVAEVIIPEALRHAHRMGLAHFLATGEGPLLNQRTEVDALHKEGHILPIELSIWLTDESQSTSGPRFSAIAHDITDRRQAAAELADVTQRALEASQLKSEFLANMSHEIRTPMNGVVGMTALLLDSELNAEQREQATVVKRSAEALLTVINDILDFSKIEAGHMELEHEDIDIRELVEEVRLLFAPTAQRKGLDLSATVATVVPGVIDGDAGRLRQVLLNIVGNAVKFTDTGSVQLACSLDVANNRLYFEVTDTGIGIAPESRARLFDSFVQVDMSSTRLHEGTGLGLAISSRLVTLMDGDIGVRSEHGIGSTFWFSVAIGDSQDTPRIDTPKSDRLPSGMTPKVLVVEDNEINQRVAAMTLEKLGCTVRLVADGASAVELLKRENFNIIFMDCQMPGMDGYEATRRIRIDEGADTHTVIVAMTASAMHGDKEKALGAGMDDYLAKPVKMESFVHVLTKWLSSDAVAPAAALGVKDGVKDALKVDLSTLESLKNKTSSNPSVYASIVTTFLQQAVDLVSTISEAADANDRVVLGKAAHKLRGSSATLGANEMARICTEIEVSMANNPNLNAPEGELPLKVAQLKTSLAETRLVFAEEIAD